MLGNRLLYENNELYCRSMRGKTKTATGRRNR
jgi:hypothetical protein